MGTESRYRIMVVDDDPDIRQVIAETLKDKYEVVMAHDGLDALEKLEKYEPDFVIMDMLMPLMDGFQACAAIRRKPGFQNLQVLFLSAYGSRENIAKSYEMGANLFIPKPVEPARLLKNVDLFLTQSPPAKRPKKMSYRQIQMIASVQEKKAADHAPHPPATPHRPAPQASSPWESPDDTAPTPEAKPRPVPPEAPPAQPDYPPLPTPQAQPVQTRHIPAAPTPPLAAPSPPSPAVSPAGSALVSRILVVEDDNDLAEMILLTLSETFEVVIARDGLEGVEKVVKAQPDILLIDVMLPKMNGYQLCQSVRSNRAFARTPIIIMTAKRTSKEREYAVRVGADAFLPKPFEMEVLQKLCVEMTRRPGFQVKAKTLSCAQLMVDGRKDLPRAFQRDNKKTDRLHDPYGRKG
jgi:DNA-binding response OmpR family regulator